MWREFVELAEKRQEPFSALCARFGVSRKTGYKWINRFRAQGVAGLQPRSRRPKSSPRRTPPAVIEAVLALRRLHPAWSVARVREELSAQGVAPLPAPSTVDLILRRQRDAAAAQQRALGPEAQRFEPNFRWQIQTGEDLRLADDTVLAPTTVRDETTGFLVGAALLPPGDETELAGFVTGLLQRHGLPWRIAFARRAVSEPAARMHSPLTVWLMRLGVAVEFSAVVPEPADGARQQLAARLIQLPAYQRALLTERTSTGDPLTQLAGQAGYPTHAAAAQRLEQIRERHNFGGSQEALQRRSPISLYRPSPRPFPAEAPTPVYAPEAEVRLVSEKGLITYQRRLIQIGRAFAGLCVELKLTPWPERYVVLFAAQALGLVDLSAAAIDSTTSLPLGAM
jgi:hypothetical protein